MFWSRTWRDFLGTVPTLNNAVNWCNVLQMCNALQINSFASKEPESVTTVLALIIDEVGHNCWVLEVYLLGI